jgi:hypothetical protein
MPASLVVATEKNILLFGEAAMFARLGLIKISAVMA